MSTERILVIAVFTALFFTTITYGWNFIKEINKENESFTNPVATSTAPTRASDCRCLPGYIPSNTPVAKRLGFENELIEVKTPMNVKYGSDSNWVSKYVTSTFRATNSFFGKDPNPGVRKQVEIDTTPLQTYFCQSLSDPATTKKCY